MAKLNKKDVIASVDTSMVVDQYARVTRVPVGDVAISQTLLTKKNAWGGEPSGTFIWPEFSLCPDGIRSAALIADQWDLISQELDHIPTYPMERIRIPCPNEKKQELLSAITRKAEKLGTVTTIDGVRVQTTKGWFLVRPSGTEPVMRVVAEAKDPESLQELLGTAKSLLKP
jgi:phosphoglucosamine mutase